MNKGVLTFILAIALLAFDSRAQIAGDPTPLQFHSSTEEARFHRLTSELRCVMCQNQSLADSNAQIAHDMRREVMDLMRQGKSDAEIKQFLVDRYGKFVLYNPPIDSHTWLLWFGPALLLIAGAIVVVLIVRRRNTSNVDIPADEQEW
ncbi:MAG: cytochrome c-type biogenesis protein CcmH [Xanthomonadaceae bacterium]|jgi:cytochrome c-type biogenesis protein CcmH|nr:cytochrome c-type biogenesis protein CcmH [Xanthomonadaceae bacterium]